MNKTRPSDHSASSRPLVIIAVVLAGLAGYLMWMYGRQLEQRYRPGTPVEVVVAATRLASGTTLRLMDLRGREVPDGYVRSGAVRVRDIDEAENRTLVNGLEPGDVLLWSDLSGGEDRQTTLGKHLDKTQRALTIRVNRVSSAGGNLRPGDRVDVMATLVNPNKGVDTTVTLLQNVSVIATGNKIGRESATGYADRRAKAEFDTVTLLLHDAKEAQMLTFAQNQGKLDLVVRSPESVEDGDDASEDTQYATDYSTIFGKERKVIQKRRRQIEILRLKDQ